MFQGLTRGKETSGRNVVMNVHMMKPFLYELTFSGNRRIRFGRFCSYESMKTLTCSPIAVGNKMQLSSYQ